MTKRRVTARGVNLPSHMRAARDAWNRDHPVDRPGGFRFENVGTAGVPADLYIYDEISWWGLMAADFVAALATVTNDAMIVHVNSPGGDVFDGIAIMNAITSHPAHVTMRVDGIAASIASVITMAGDVVQMMPLSQMMIHNASGGAWGDSVDLRLMADLLDRQSLNIANAYQARAGGDLADWQLLMDAETWLFATEAVELGLADEVIAKGGDAPTDFAGQGFVYAGRQAAPTPVIPQSIRLAAKGDRRDDAADGAGQDAGSRDAADRLARSVAAGRAAAVGGGREGEAAFVVDLSAGSLADTRRLLDQLGLRLSAAERRGGSHPPVRCRCVTEPVATIAELRAYHHLDECPLSTEARLRAVESGVTNIGVLWDWVLGDGGVSGNCAECIDLADNGPYDESALPDFPNHPNDTCELQVAYGTNDRAAHSPSADQPTVISASDARAVLRELTNA